MSGVGPDAVILAGGRGTRLGGARKAALTVGGASLLARTVAALRAADVGAVVAAGPPLSGIAGLRWVREDPPFGGPVAGLAAALPHVRTAWLLLLPVDLAEPGAAVRDLLAADADADGVCLVDEAGARQWVTGRYRTAALRRAVAERGAGIAGSAMRTLVGDLRVAGRRGAAADLDTWEDLGAARRRAAGGKETTMAEQTPRTLPPEALEEWARVLRERFGLAAEDVPIALILDLARDVATGVARPAAPFSAFVAGLVAGRAGGTPEQVRQAVAAISALAAEAQAAPPERGVAG